VVPLLAAAAERRRDRRAAVRELVALLTTVDGALLAVIANPDIETPLLAIEPIIARVFSPDVARLAALGDLIDVYESIAKVLAVIPRAHGVLQSRAAEPIISSEEKIFAGMRTHFSRKAMLGATQTAHDAVAATIERLRARHGES
jgi:hypothetical protein